MIIFALGCIYRDIGVIQCCYILTEIVFFARIKQVALLAFCACLFADFWCTCDMWLCFHGKKNHDLLWLCFHRKNLCYVIYCLLWSMIKHVKIYLWFVPTHTSYLSLSCIFGKTSSNIIFVHCPFAFLHAFTRDLSCMIVPMIRPWCC
jgi:hypothetical protein